MPYSQYAQVNDGAGYYAVGNTIASLQPGYYDLASVDGQLFFFPVRARDDDLLEFPDSVSKEVLEGISGFWDREDKFRAYGLPYKRGILLYGPPGSGKTCTLQLVSRDVVARGGVVITFHPALFLRAYRAFRDIQPETHMVVLMEDIDATLKGNESLILNLLDGVESLDKVVFLATTNYPEKLEGRIMNRPSRFDMCVRVPHPDATSREIYVRSLLRDGDDLDVGRYVKDTEDMSLAHIKELFVATVILNCDYEVTVDRLRRMRDEKASSAEDDRPKSSWGAFV